MIATRTSLFACLVAATAACSKPPTGGATTDAVAPVTPRAAASSSTVLAEAVASASPAQRLVLEEAAQDTDALSLIRTKRLQAKADGRVLVVYVGATWCAPCKRFKAEVESGRLDARLGNTTLLAFDADRDAARLAAAGYSFQFVPFVALPGADGRPADTKQATRNGGDAWRELLGKLEAWQSGT